jgi:hypothetical protein
MTQDQHASTPEQIAMAICESEAMLWLMHGSGHVDLHLHHIRQMWEQGIAAGGQPWGTRRHSAEPAETIERSSLGWGTDTTASTPAAAGTRSARHQTPRPPSPNHRSSNPSPATYKSVAHPIGGDAGGTVSRFM